MKIGISAESTVDLPQELLDKYNIITIPFGINFKDELVEDRLGISKEIYEFVEKTKVLPKTSAIGPTQYKEYFEGILKDYDAVVHLSISSQMSSAYNNACLVAKEMENIYVVDSKNLSTGIALLAIYASDLNKKKKYSAKEIAEMVAERANNVRASFVLDKLNYMYKGGRCNAVTLLGANLLKIKPQIVVKDGRMVVGKKYRGVLSKVIENYCEDTLAEFSNADKSLVFITHSSPMPEIADMLRARLEKFGFETIYETDAGGTICSHCGPDTIGILYVEK